MEAYLTVETGPLAGDSHTLGFGETFVLGSGPGASLRLEEEGVAPHHTALRLDGDGLRVVDLGSPGGTLLNEERLGQRQPTPVQAGDAIAVGETTLRVELTGEDAAALRRKPSRRERVIPADEFEILEELGRGAMGRVVAATRRSDGRQVGIKVLHGEVDPDSLDHQRLLREGRLGERLRSPYLAEVLELREAAGQAFIVMERIAGPSLEDHLIASGPLGLEAGLRIGEHVALALAAAASLGVIHRDVKPANILLAPDGIAKLTDFGISKDLQSTVRSLTVSGVGLGTLAYMAPEQIAEARHVDTGADIYALGGPPSTTPWPGIPPFRFAVWRS